MTTKKLTRLPGSRDLLLDPYRVKGFVHWELIDDKTGRVTRRGRGKHESWWMKAVPKTLQKLFLLGDENAIVDTGRNRLAQYMIGTSITSPNFIGIGTGTNGVAASDTALQTPVDYDGANDAKASATRSLKGQYTARIVTNFLATEANQNIRELGLFDAANSGNMWARVSVTINKAASERLNIYWYVVFERRIGLAIKTGASIATTGNVTAQADSTLTFASAVTILAIKNNTGGDVYIMLNAAMSGTPPTSYDFLLEDNDELWLNNEEVQVSTVHVYKDSAGNLTMPHNQLSVRGW